MKLEIIKNEKHKLWVYYLDSRGIIRAWHCPSFKYFLSTIRRIKKSSDKKLYNIDFWCFRIVVRSLHGNLP